MARQQVDVLQNLVNRLRAARKEAGDRLGDMLADGLVRERAAAVADKIEDLRLEMARRLRGGEPPEQPTPEAVPEPTPKAREKPTARARGRAATKPLDDMTVRELHELASKRQIAGRSAMNKAELVDALRKG